MERIRTKMEIQERALVALIRCGDAQKKTIEIELTTNKKDEFEKKEHTFYKVPRESQYDLRSQPRREPMVCRCCASCMNKKYVVREGQLVRICRLTRERISPTEVCDNQQLKDFYWRI